MRKMRDIGFEPVGANLQASYRDIESLYRARLAGETGHIIKEHGGRLSVALVYANSYRLGMSNLGFQAVYRLLNSRPDVAAERVFLPEGAEMSLYVRSGRPLLSLETSKPLYDFDVVAFSLSFEHDYLNVLKMLEMGRIMLLGVDRDADEPLVTAGGVVTYLNPEPLADFIDVFIPGDAEVTLDPFVESVFAVWQGGGSRRDRLDRLAVSNPSVYVPSCYSPEYGPGGTLAAFRPLAAGVPEKIHVERAWGSSWPPACSTGMTRESEFSDMFLVETGRGCGRSCRFCAAGYVYRPPRFHAETAIQSLVEGPAREGRRIGLVGTAVSDMPGIEQICSSICDSGGSFSLSSLRADNIDGEFVGLLSRGGQRSLSIAPEAGSERLRRVINKHLTMEQLTDAVATIAHAGDFSIRLYVLIGLPTESVEDRHALVRMVKELKHTIVKASADRGTIGRIRLSVNCFVPKPFTPFQWAPFGQVSTLNEARKTITRSLAREGGIRVSCDVPKWAYVQALLSLGDRRVGGMLLNAHRFSGDWKRAFKYSDVNPDFFVYRPKGFDEVFPWDFLDHGIRKSFLKKEYLLALEGKESEVCRAGECTRCGVCMP
ncbi:MAG: radical SAM protein [Desulfatiglandaceae bacterium]